MEEGHGRGHGGGHGGGTQWRDMVERHGGGTWRRIWWRDSSGHWRKCGSKRELRTHVFKYKLEAKLKQKGGKV